MRAAIYIRVSTDRQAEEGFSIDAQKRKLFSYCESQDWIVSDVYLDDGESAKSLDRPDMKRMLGDMEAGLFDVVLCYKLDRLTRSVLDLYTLLNLFDQHNVKFKSASEVYDTTTAMGRLFLTLVSALAQWERENIGERTRFGLEEKARGGERPAGKIPYGYGKDGEIVEDEAEELRKIRYMYMVDNIGFMTIASRLTDSKRRWTGKTIGKALSNPYYAGIIRYGSIESEGSQARIWSREDYVEHMAVIDSRRKSGYSRKQDFWFTGLLQCGACGRPMSGRITLSPERKDGTIRKASYYQCITRTESNRCKMPMFRQTHVEHLLFNHINTIVLDPVITSEEQSKYKSLKDSRDREQASLKRELAAISERRKKWQYAFVNDSISVEDLRDRQNEESLREAAIRHRMEQLQFTDVGDNTTVKAQLRNMKDIWPHLDDLGKQELMRIIFNRITLYTDERKVRGTRAKFFDASIEVKYN